MTDSIFSFDNGNVTTYPLPSLTSNPTPILQLADPVMLAIAQAFTQFLNTNLLPRFADEAKACGLTHANLDNWVDGYGVAQTIVFPLDENLLRVTDFRFPLLAIQPVSSDMVNLTLTNTAVNRTFKMAWILPPLTVAQMNRLYPFLGLAEKIILGYGNQGYDPKVSPDGPSFWTTAGLTYGSLHGSKYEPYKGLAGKGTNLTKANFPTLEVTLSFVERNQNPVPQNFIDFSGIDLLQLNVVDGYNPANPIVNFIDGYILPDITLTGCTPNTGSFEGNTLLTITGTGFSAQKIQQASQLTICGSPAAGLTVDNSNTLTVITNQGVFGQGGVTGNVVLTDLQGNTYTLTDAFTYLDS